MNQLHTHFYQFLLCFMSYLYLSHVDQIENHWMNPLQPPGGPLSTSPKGHETVSIGVLLEFTISQVVQNAENGVVSIVVGL